MNLNKLISSLDLREDLSKPELYSNIKLISDYINPNLSTLNKPELIKLISGLKKYIQNKNTKENQIYIFGDNNINLDKEQIEIVHTNPDTNMRVIAGAGSGKTTTVLCRVKYILDNYTTPDRILILTFNKDSAQNIRNRIGSLFGFDIYIQIYTIDAFCCKLLNYYKYETDTKIYSLSEYSNTGLALMKKYGKEITSQYKYIFFDEFQDVNDVQFSILKIFVDNGCYLTVIGDDCQNIYQFRGTNNYYMVNFDKIIKSQTHKLTTNYRSTKSIVDLANKSISFNEFRIEKEMKANKSNIKYIPETDLEISKPKFVLAGSEGESVSYICKKIKLLIENGVKLDRIAVLARNSYPLKLIETQFTKIGLEHVACISDKNTDDIKRILLPNKIAVTTIHKSKGLEWDVVFILGLSHEHWPAHLNNNIKNIEEERRLFYVGVTRAKYSLYLVSSINEIPLSIFLHEVYDHFVQVRYKLENKLDKKELFNFSEVNLVIKESYGVNELVTLLDPNDLLELREKKLIPNIEPSINKIFNTSQDINFTFTPKIKSNTFEPDIGEFCDRYITRGIICKQLKKFNDIDTEFIVGTKELDEQDYSMLNLLKSNPNIFKISKNNNNEYKHLIEIIELIEKNGLNCVRKFTYPKNIINIINKAYERVKDFNINNNELIEEIYWVSLCRNFRNDRNRLVYKNIYSLVKENLEIKSNETTLLKMMDKIIDFLSNFKTECKINVIHKLKSSFDKKCLICGEIDFINLDKKTIIDFKCSESDFKLEWLVQLLIYYSLYKEKDLIDKISIINIFNGLEYIFDVPKDYNTDALIKFLEEKIIKDQNSIRPKPSIGFESIDSIYKNIINKKNIFEIKYNLLSEEKRIYSMVLDTETSDFNGDILQISWIIIRNSDFKIVSESNYFIKNRLPSKEAFEVHKISIDKLRKIGSDFTVVITNFIRDIEKCTSIIGHNIGYDLRCLLKNMRKYDISIVNSKNTVFNIFEYYDIICTKKLSGNKSLDKLYWDLYKKNIEDAHDSYFDVINTYKCYIKIIEQIEKEVSTKL